MTNLEKAARQALEYLDNAAYRSLTDHGEAITALREALAEQTEQEPVAWRVRGYNQFKTGNPASWRYVDGVDKPSVNKPDCCDFEPLYAAPVQKAKQEPVAWTAASNIVNDGYGHSFSVVSSEPANTTGEPYVPLYAAPVRTKDLTDDEISEVVFSIVKDTPTNYELTLCRAVIAADREKNK